MAREWGEMKLSRKSWSIGGAALVALVGVASGCGGSSSNASGPTANQACADQAHAACTKRDSCSLSGYLNHQTYGDEQTCEMRTTLTCVSALAAKGTAQSPAHVESCVAEYGSYACTNYYENNPSGACVPPAGSGTTGAPCGAAAQCASSYCAIPQQQVCGTCQPLPKPGATCQVNADCGRDLECAIPTGMTTGTCAAYVAANGACLSGSQPCEPGQACVGDDEATGQMGACQPQGTSTGAACDSSRKTASNCDGALGLACIPSAAGSGVGTCQPITLAADGSPCGPVGSKPITGFATCQAGGLCVKATATATTGTCVAPVADGAACDSDPTKGPPCLMPAKCVVPSGSSATAGTCRLPDASKCL
jgi:hypothetical protein